MDVWLLAQAYQALGIPGLLTADQRDEIERMKREAPAGIVMRGTAYVWWAYMVKDGARWDFKDQIQDELGDDVMLCGFDECYWFEYSMPGNIFYAYVGRAAGFSEFEIRAGAVYAQQTDPENNPRLNDWYGLDQASDQAAIELGFELYDRAQGTANEDILKIHFKAMVNWYHDRLARGRKPTEPYVTEYPVGPDGTQFPLRFFDGTNFLGPFGE